MSDVAIIILLLLLIAGVSSVVLQKLKVPYTIGLVVIGVLLSLLLPKIGIDSSSIGLTPDLILYVMLPALIFEPAINIDTRALKKNLFPTITLAAPGLVISTLIVGGILYLCTKIPLEYCMLFGALISATDPVAVISLFKDLGAPKRLTMLVDSESLFNDATAIVLFNVIKGLIAAGVALTFNTCITSTLSFTIVFLAGLLVGAVVGLIMTFTIASAKKQPQVQVLMSSIAAYAAFIIADKVFEVSGVMAVLSAGIVISHYGATHFNSDIKKYMLSFWELMAFVANSFIFLLLGFTEIRLIEHIGEDTSLWASLGWAVVAVLVSRAIVVFVLCPVVGLLRPSNKISIPYQLIMFWGGLRGAVPMALVLSLGNDPLSNTLITLTLGIILFTLVVQGTTIKALMTKLGLANPDPFTLALRKFAQVESHVLCQKKIDRFVKNELFENSAVQQAYQDFIHEREKLQDSFWQMLNSKGVVEKQFIRSLWMESLSVQKSTFSQLFDIGILSPRMYRKLLDFNEGFCDSLADDSINWFVVYKEKLNFKINSFMDKVIDQILTKVPPLSIHYAPENIYEIEKSIAIYFSSSSVMRMLDEVKVYCDTRKNEWEKVHDLFKEIMHNALECLNQQKEVSPDKASSILQKISTRAFNRAEVNELKHLELKGVIGGDIVQNLEEHIYTGVVTR